MNKNQLAAKIWRSANKMRSKIEANEYKDYILGFIFYKFLSDKEEQYLINQGVPKDCFKENLIESVESSVTFCQDNLGYFIGYDNLYSTWLSKGKDFGVDNVRDALSAFERLLYEKRKDIDSKGQQVKKKKVFSGIFKTLETGLSKLGEGAGAQTKAISDLLNLIKDIPMDGKQGYDVLGFIYEYLIGMFAANAGKKAGEFYTPYEVSKLKSEIIAWHLRNRDSINFYDSCSGSGSLLINIGEAAKKYIGNSDKIKYYAQELKESTYNLTRMNLIMRGIKPDNIFVRNGDTLEDDWPYFDDSTEYNTLYVDGIASNPPYSQNWSPYGKDSDPRYARFGLAPSGYADYAFLLHDLYHLKPDGIMTIVLPHGVLFRGNEEAKIRKELLESNHIDAIIGLPSGIFFGTGIATIIMVLKQQRQERDVLFIDASKGFTKEGKGNKLRDCDIKKILDAYINRSTIATFSRKVNIEEIRNNEYDLYIPRYIDSSDAEENWDIYATVCGGIPAVEINKLNKYWDVFPELKNKLFTVNENGYYIPKGNASAIINNDLYINKYIYEFKEKFVLFEVELYHLLISERFNINIPQAKEKIANDIFNCIKEIYLINPYTAYQVFADMWVGISSDLEMIQTEGDAAIRVVEPNMVIKKKKDGTEEEIQKGWLGRIIPFELIYSTLLSKESSHIKKLENEQERLETAITDIIESLDIDEINDVLNDDNNAFVEKELKNKLNSFIEKISTKEIFELREYLKLLDVKSQKAVKLEYIKTHSNVHWENIEIAKDGTYGKKAILNRINQLVAEYQFPENSIQARLFEAMSLLENVKSLKSLIKKLNNELQEKTIDVIHHLTDEQAKKLLKIKWIDKLMPKLYQLPSDEVNDFITKIIYLNKKYNNTLYNIESNISKSSNDISSMSNELYGKEIDIQGLKKFMDLLQGV